MTEVEPVIQHLIDDGAQVIVEFGSSTCEGVVPRDRDLLCVFPDNDSRTNFELGKFDVTRLSRPEMDGYCEVFDPVYATEPILTGDVIYGDSSYIRQKEKYFQSENPGRRTVHHNMKNAFEQYRIGVNHYQSQNVSEGLFALSFALSRWAVAGWYSEGKQPRPVSEVVEERGVDELYHSVRTDAKQASSDENITHHTLSKYLNQWYLHTLNPTATVDST